MIGNANEIERAFEAWNAMGARIIAAHHNMMQCRGWVFRTGLERKIAGATDTDAGLYERRSGGGFGRRQIVQSSTLVIVALATPIRDLVDQLAHIGPGLI